ncbi:MAG TPA: hypothetical protein VG965_02575 [Patescibacteria group bacterium]|nr:hypothetical protein [Patescibacteria group bacterium]
MPKQTTILIVILAVVTGVLIFLALTNQNLKFANNNQATTPTPTPVKKTAKVYFNPTTVEGGAAPVSVDMMVDTGGSPIAGVQAELQYDPNVLSAVKVVPAVDATSFFGTNSTILFNDVKATTGRVSYVIAIPAGQSGKSGVGKIGSLVFERAPGATALSTTVTFLDKTLVTMLNVNSSVLNTTTPLTITFGKGAATKVVAPNKPSTPAQSSGL